MTIWNSTRFSRRRLALTLAAASIVGTGCGDDGHTHDHDHDTMGGDTLVDTTSGTDVQDDAEERPDLGSGDAIAPEDRITTETLADGTTRRSVIQAYDSAAWVYFDFDTGLGVAPNDPGTDAGWHLSFQRYRVLANGGTSGPLGVAVAYADDADFASIEAAPAEGWQTDDDTATTDTGETLYAFAHGGSWYDYDGSNHVLTPKTGRVWFVRVPGSSGEAYFKLWFRDYYDASGNAGVLTIDWAPVAAPAEVLPAGAFRVPNGKVNLATASADETTWDVEVGVNGTVAIASVAGAVVATDDWDSTDTTDTVGFVVDTEMPAPGPPGSPTLMANALLSEWYDYNPSTHAVSPKETVWVVRRLDGTYRAFRILGYDESGWVLQAKDIAAAPVVHTVSFDAPSAAGIWAQIDLGLGVVLDPTTSVDAAWDLAFLGVNVRTNSGTSGEGSGGAVATEATDLAAADDVPTDGWAVDAMSPIPGPPGSGEISANPVLGGWYDYNTETHVVSPKDTIFAVRLHDGSVARLRVDAYASGAWTISWIYGGPGATRF